MDAITRFLLQKFVGRLMNVEIEIFLVRFDEDDVIYAKYSQNITRNPLNPDHIVSRLCVDNNHLSAQFLQGTGIIHSTSWQYAEREEGSLTILTYIIYSDHLHFRRLPMHSIPFSRLNFSFKSSPQSDLGEDIADEDILSHGLRHLGYLVQNDENGIGKVLNENSLAKFKAIDIALGGKLN